MSGGDWDWVGQRGSRRFSFDFSIDPGRRVSMVCCFLLLSLAYIPGNVWGGTGELFAFSDQGGAMGTDGRTGEFDYLGVGRFTWVLASAFGVMECALAGLGGLSWIRIGIGMGMEFAFSSG